MSPLIDMWVAGTPKPKGSVQAFVPTDKRKRPVRRPDGGIVVNITDDNPGTRAWMKTLKGAVSPVFQQAAVEGRALDVELACFLERPEGQFGTGRNMHLVKDHAPAYPIAERSGDVDKLARCILDALTEVVWKTDAAIRRLVIEKHYAVPDEFGDGQGAALRVFEAECQTAQDLPVEARVRVIRGRPRADPPVAEGQLALDAA